MKLIAYWTIRMCMARMLSLILLFLAVVPGLFSQVDITQRPRLSYTVQDGLSSNEVHRVVSDDQGLLWFATDNGICSFNGVEWVTVGSSINVDASYLDLKRMSDGRIWWQRQNGQLGWIEEGELIEYEDNNLIDSIYKGKELMFSFDLDEDGAVQACFRRLGTMVFRDGLAEQLKCDHNHGEHFHLTMHSAYPNAPLKMRLCTFSEVVPMECYLNDSLLARVDDIGYLTFSDFRNYNDHQLFWTSNMLFELQGEKLDKVTFSAPLVFAKDVGEERFVSLLNEGLKVRRGEEFVSLLEGCTATDVELDIEGNFWVSTLESGVFMLPLSPVHFTGIPEDLKGDNVQDIESDGVSVIRCIDENGAIWECTNGQWINSGRSTQDDLSKLFQTTGGSWFLSNREATVLLPDFEWVCTGYCTDAFVDKEGQLLILSSSGVYDPAFQLENGFIPLRSTVPSYQHLRSSNGTDYLRLSRGVGIWQNDQVQIDFLGIRERLAGMVEWGGDIVFGTRSNGLIFWNEKDEKLSRVSLNEPFNSVTCLDADHRFLYVGTRKGLLVIEHIRKDPPQHIERFWFSAKHGLPSNIIKDIALVDNELFVLTDLGMALVSLEAVEGIKEVELAKGKVNLNGLGPNGTVDLNQGDNLEGKLEIVSILEGEGLAFRYRLEGLQDTWTYSSDPLIFFSRMPYGQYTLRAEVSTWNTGWQQIGENVRIEVGRAFWQSELFQFMLWIVVAMGIGFLVSAYQTRRKLKKNAEKALQSRLLKAELLSLKSQMNPHFTFNILSSIQSLLVQGDNDKALSYLSRFSTHLRAVLDDGELIFNDLGKEWGALVNYIRLEKLRFPDKFEVVMPESVPEEFRDVKVPAMILQPIVENAIRHGLIPRAGKGLLKISLRFEQNGMIVQVLDNGPGRKIINEADDREHIGEKNVMDRVNLIAEIYKVQCRIDWHVAYPGKEFPGTCAELTIPIRRKV